MDKHRITFTVSIVVCWLRCEEKNANNSLGDGIVKFPMFQTAPSGSNNSAICKLPQSSSPASIISFIVAIVLLLPLLLKPLRASQNAQRYFNILVRLQFRFEDTS